ncbi:hypothetical protein [Kaistia sp. MMO-174]|uniref:hypothetical protein n=1 Tax=Kaistia sp. MMO-174 TaxID=3081256 RepID=UPI00301B47E7
MRLRLNPIDILSGALSGALESVIGPDDPGTPGVSEAVTKAVVQEVAKDPAIQHMTNTEPWYQSRVTWGALVAIASGLFAIGGRALPVEDQGTLVNIAVAVASAIGGAITLYGRWAARKPLGR